MKLKEKIGYDWMAEQPNTYPTLDAYLAGFNAAKAIAAAKVVSKAPHSHKDLLEDIVFEVGEEEV